MTDLNKLTKRELVNILQEIQTILDGSIVEASEAANKYDSDRAGRLAFEVGYLGGIIKSCQHVING
jgi:hypothetical protein